jgi:hemin uptake protein HemP
MSAREGTRRIDAAPRPLVIHTEQLFGAAREVIIEHGEEEYRLRIMQ